MIVPSGVPLCLLRKRVAEHRAPALGLLFCGVVLNDVPVLDENSVLQANDVRCDLVHRMANIGEPVMKDDVVAFCKNHSGFIFERWRRGLIRLKSPYRPDLM